MAGDWIKMKIALRTHPKVVRISSACNADILRTLGALFSLWSIFDEHSTNGKLSGYTLETMDHELRWSGFCAAVVSVGWLEVSADGQTLIAPKYEENNSKTAKRRATEASRKREKRRPQNVRKMSASNADKKRTREEKRREEKNMEDLTSSIPPVSETAKPKTKAKKPDYDPLAEVLPFASPAFAATWADWVEFRKTRKPAITAQSAKAQLTEWAGFTEEAVTQAIRSSIANGYQGVFPAKFASSGGKSAGGGGRMRDESGDYAAYDNHGVSPEDVARAKAEASTDKIPF